MADQMANQTDLFKHFLHCLFSKLVLTQLSEDIYHIIFILDL